MSTASSSSPSTAGGPPPAGPPIDDGAAPAGAAFSFPPGPRGPMPLHAARFAKNTWGFLASCRERFGDTFTLDLPGGGKWVFLTDPEHVKQVYAGDPKVFHAGEGNSILLPLLGRHSVLLLDEQPHLRQRKLLLPPFHGKRMAGYEDLMRSIARDTIAGWPVGTPLKAWPQMQAVTLEIIMRAVFGVQEGARLDVVPREVVHPGALRGGWELRDT